MTADQWRDELVRLAMEAIDAADVCGHIDLRAEHRGDVKQHLRERMAQAAQRIEGDVAAAFKRGAESHAAADAQAWRDWIVAND